MSNIVLSFCTVCFTNAFINYHPVNFITLFKLGYCYGNYPSLAGFDISHYVQYTILPKNWHKATFIPSLSENTLNSFLQISTL